MATKQNEAAKNQIIKILRSQGYATYARLLDKFDVFLTDDPQVIAYMVPQKAKIVLNQNLNTNQVSTVVRHEILHEYLTHFERQQKFDSEHPDRLTTPDLANIAADYEISNRGYTELDKQSMRRLALGDKILSGLITEDQYPNWKNKTFEEMYDALTDEFTKDKKDLQDALQPLLQQSRSLNKKDIDDMDQQANDLQGDTGSEEKQDNKSSSKDPKGTDSNVTPVRGKGEEKDPSKESSNSQEKEIQKAAKEAEDELDKAKDDLKDIKGDKNNPIMSPSDQRDLADVARRVSEIQDMLNDLEQKKELLDETDKVVHKEKQKEIERREIERIKRGSTSLEGFKMNLSKFIRDQLSEYRGDTWSRPSKNYLGTDFIMPGKTSYAPSKIPSINVYWDVSGSFDNPAKTEGARNAIALLNEYVRKNMLKIHTYYFAERVSDNKSEAGGGTMGTPILNHVKQTNPTNVIVITDGDITDCKKFVQVPGAVWYLFYDSMSENIVEHLQGKKQTKTFMVKS